MVQYFKFSIVYFSAALVILMLVREDGYAPLLWAWGSAGMMVGFMAKYVAAALVIGVGWAAYRKPDTILSVIVAVLAGAAGTLLFHSGFTLIKTSMPYIVPFYGDQMFADLDAWLHGGRAAWEVVRDLPFKFNMENADLIYLGIWSIPAACFPAIVAGVDRNEARVKRTIILYVLAWLLLGNVLALLGMSAGPVYYDRVIGGERFAELATYLVSSGYTETRMGMIQENLWDVYVEQGQAFGSGISAFPSVHVGVAMVSAIYLWERSRWLLIVGAPFVMTIFFLSVASGYHYAVDGYMSAAVIFAAWRWMLYRDAKASLALPDQSMAGAIPAE